MASVLQVNCEHCGKVLRINEKYAGKKGQCPNCRNTIQVPSREQFKAQQENTAAQKTKNCPTCGAYLNPDDVICISCYTNLATGEWDMQQVGYKPSSESYPFLTTAGILLGITVLLLLGAQWARHNTASNTQQQFRVSNVASAPTKTPQAISPAVSAELLAIKKLPARTGPEIQAKIAKYRQWMARHEDQTLQELKVELEVLKNREELLMAQQSYENLLLQLKSADLFTQWNMLTSFPVRYEKLLYAPHQDLLVLDSAVIAQVKQNGQKWDRGLSATIAPDVFCVVFLQQHQSWLKVFQSKVVKNTYQPCWSHALPLDITPQARLKFVFYDHDLRQHDLIGQVLVTIPARGSRHLNMVKSGAVEQVRLKLKWGLVVPKVRIRAQKQAVLQKITAAIKAEHQKAMTDFSKQRYWRALATATAGGLQIITPLIVYPEIKKELAQMVPLSKQIQSHLAPPILEGPPANMVQMQRQYQHFQQVFQELMRKRQYRQARQQLQEQQEYLQGLNAPQEQTKSLQADMQRKMQDLDMIAQLFQAADQGLAQSKMNTDRFFTSQGKELKGIIGRYDRQTVYVITTIAPGRKVIESFPLYQLSTQQILHYANKGRATKETHLQGIIFALYEGSIDLARAELIKAHQCGARSAELQPYRNRIAKAGQ